jgi:hypothetical protein
VHNFIGGIRVTDMQNLFFNKKFISKEDKEGIRVKENIRLIREKAEEWCGKANYMCELRQGKSFFNLDKYMKKNFFT